MRWARASTSTGSAISRTAAPWRRTATRHWRMPSPTLSSARRNTFTTPGSSCSSSLLAVLRSLRCCSSSRIEGVERDSTILFQKQAWRKEKRMLQFITDNATDTQATLAANPMFAGLDQAERAAFELGSGSVRLAAGEILFRQGDPGDALYLIVSGRLGVRVANADGIETIVDDLRPPASVGELALLTEQVRGATVFALEDAELARVTREDVRRLAQRRPQLIAALTWAV